MIARIIQLLIFPAQILLYIAVTAFCSAVLFLGFVWLLYGIVEIASDFSWLMPPNPTTLGR